MIYITASSYQVANAYAKALLPILRSDWKYVNQEHELRGAQNSILICTFGHWKQPEAHSIQNTAKHPYNLSQLVIL